jgi:hypothetical protein
MPVLRCTSKLLAEIDDPVAFSPSNPSSIGDWYGQIFSVNRRKCILFIHEPTLFVCFASGVTKALYRQIAPFFRDVLKSTLQIMQFTAKEAECILGFHADLMVGKTINRSTVGSLNNRITDAKCLIAHHGGFDYISPQSVVKSLNHRPMKPIGYSKGLEELKGLAVKLMK